ncbi:hypothetical protein KC332_g2199 [Hortaea werneckii]|nr:hypothetical protein KC332_g2199 [Hortaea werneckii]
MPGVNDHKARRTLTRNACMRCRARKAKCNGKRPSCQSCLAKGLHCGYDTACEGWERMFGDQAAFQIHLSALQEMTTKRGAQRSREPSLDTGLIKFPSLPAAARLPDGFGNLRVLGLLPNSLLDLISRLGLTDRHEQVDMNERRRVPILLMALKPTGRPAVDAFVNGELGLQVAECVRISAMMFVTLVLAVTDNDDWNQPMLSAIEPTYSDTHGIPVETLVGSVYDEVLLWSLCVFYALAGRLVARQLRCFRRLLRAFMIPPEAKSWPSLQRLMKRYLHHPYFDKPIRDSRMRGVAIAFRHRGGRRALEFPENETGENDDEDDDGDDGDGDDGDGDDDHDADDDDLDDVVQIDHVENGQLTNDTLKTFIPVYSRSRGDRHL